MVQKIIYQNSPWKLISWFTSLESILLVLMQEHHTWETKTMPVSKQSCTKVLLQPQAQKTIATEGPRPWSTMSLAFHTCFTLSQSTAPTSKLCSDGSSTFLAGRQKTKPENKIPWTLFIRHCQTPVLHFITWIIKENNDYVDPLQSLKPQREQSSF